MFGAVFGFIAGIPLCYQRFITQSVSSILFLIFVFANTLILYSMCVISCVLFFGGLWIGFNLIRTKMYTFRGIQNAEG